MFKLALPLSFGVLTSILVSASGCAVEDAESVDVAEETLRGTRTDPATSGKTTRDLFYLGSRDFLRNCAGNTYGCGADVMEYTKDELYFSAPLSTVACGQKATFCKGSTCVTALRIESSDHNQHFEGSWGLIEALGGEPSESVSGCSGSGTVSGVRISWGANMESGANSSAGNGSKCIDKDGVARPPSYVLNGCACGVKGRSGDGDGDGWVCKSLEQQGNCANKCIDKEGVCRSQSYVLNGCACGVKGRTGDVDGDGWVCK